MMNDLKRFITKAVGLSALIALFGWFVFSFFLPEYFLPVFPYLLLFFLVFTISIHAYQLRLAKKDIGKFARSNMLITFFKLMVYSVAAIIYMASDKENVLTFVIGLMLLYIIFTFLEVTEITRVARNSKK